MRRRTKLGFALLAALGVAAGCGSGHPPVSDSSGGASTGGAGSGATGFTVDASAATAPPGCGTNADGTQCGCVDVPLYTDPPNIYFVLDRSGSMAEDDKWTQVRVAVGDIMRALGPRANFGAAVFPGVSSDDTCTPGAELMSVRAGDPPSASGDGPTTTFLLTATRQPPAGGTPTSATLGVVEAKLATVPGKSYVILATDGAPNCNDKATCSYDQCQPNMEDAVGCPKQGPYNCCAPPDGTVENCNDGSATLGAISSLASRSIPVYVVGLPGAATYASLLDQMATTGGTALATSPRYFSVGTANEDVMLAALKAIAAKITGTCTFELKTAPPDPSLVNVYLDEVVLPYEPVDGWTIDGTTVTLVGAACARVKSGDVLDVRIIEGCQRVGPK